MSIFANLDKRQEATKLSIMHIPNESINGGNAAGAAAAASAASGGLKTEGLEMVEDTNVEMVDDTNGRGGRLKTEGLDDFRMGLAIDMMEDELFTVRRVPSCDLNDKETLRKRVDFSMWHIADMIREAERNTLISNRKAQLLMMEVMKASESIVGRSHDWKKGAATILAQMINMVLPRRTERYYSQRERECVDSNVFSMFGLLQEVVGVCSNESKKDMIEECNRKLDDMKRVHFSSFGRYLGKSMASVEFQANNQRKEVRNERECTLGDLPDVQISLLDQMFWNWRDAMVKVNHQDDWKDLKLTFKWKKLDVELTLWDGSEPVEGREVYFKCDELDSVVKNVHEDIVSYFKELQSRIEAKKQEFNRRRQAGIPVHDFDWDVDGDSIANGGDLWASSVDLNITFHEFMNMVSRVTVKDRYIAKESVITFTYFFLSGSGYGDRHEGDAWMFGESYRQARLDRLDADDRIRG